MKERAIGAHVSAAGGFDQACQRAADIGANAVQIFSGSPRTWQTKNVSQDDIENFKAAVKENNIQYSCFHAVYLINLADTAEGGAKSVAALTHELKLAAQLGVSGSVVHTGSYKKEGRTAAKYAALLKNIKKVLADTPDDTVMMLENAGNHKIGEKIEDLGEIIRDCDNHDRLRVCLDTCHLHAAGYDLTTKKSYQQFISDFDKHVGLNRLACLHLNDSRDLLGSLRDRHDNLGEGNVGMSVFENLLTDNRLHKVPVILEVPGFDGGGPDAKNIEIAKRLDN